MPSLPLAETHFQTDLLVLGHSDIIGPLQLALRPHSMRHNSSQGQHGAEPGQRSPEQMSNSATVQEALRGTTRSESVRHLQLVSVLKKRASDVACRVFDMSVNRLCVLCYLGRVMV